MADNVPITAGTGTDVATDQVTGTAEHVQLMKLAIATDGSRTLIPADATNGLLVDVKRVQGVVAIGDGTDTVSVATAGADGESNTVNRLEVESYEMMFNGTTWDRVRGDTTSGIWVNVKADANVLVDDAAFTPATSKVLPVGFTVDDTSTDLVDEGDVGAARMTLDRRQIMQLGESGAKDVVGGGSKTDGTDQSIMAAVASTYNYLCWLTVYNASSTNTFATLKDGSTTRAIIPLPAYGGAVLQWPRGLRSTVNTAWNVAAGTSVTTAYFYGGGYTSTG